MALESVYAPIARGLVGFFAGGLMLAAFEAWRGPATRTAARAGATVATIAAWPVIVSSADSISETSRWLAMVGGSALTVLTFALWDGAAQAMSRKVAWLGDISYASYLLHFPLQLAIVLALGTRAVGAPWIREPAALIAFLVLLIAVSYVCAFGFEYPVQRALRRRWLPGARS